MLSRFTRFISLLSVLLLGLWCSLPVIAKLTGSLSVDAITERLQPEGQLRIDGEAATAQPTVAESSGPKDIYDKHCKLCHQQGIAGAPKFADNKDWAPRITVGMEALVRSAWEGVRAMPPKGNCLECSYEDFSKAVEYMIGNAK